MGIFVAISEVMALENEKARWLCRQRASISRSRNELPVQGSQYIRGDL